MLSDIEAARFSLFYFIARQAIRSPLPAAICDKCWDEMKANKKSSVAYLDN